MQEGFKFSCPSCSQRIRAFYEHIGMAINCPACETELLVPDPRVENPIVYMAVDNEHGFNAEEWDLLQTESPSVLEAIVALPKDRWWECAAMGHLLSSRLFTLKDVIANSYEMYYHIGSKDDYMAFVKYSSTMLQHINACLKNLYQFICVDFQHVLKNNNLIQIINLANKMNEQFEFLQSFHLNLFKHSLPQEDPCPEMQQILIRMTPFLESKLQMVIHQLISKGNLPRHYPNIDLQVSIFPTSIPTFMKLQQNIALNVHSM